VKRQKLREAVSEYLNAVDLVPLESSLMSRKLFRKLGVCYFHLSEYHEAVKYLSISRFEGKDIQHFLILSLCKIGETDRARTIFARFINRHQTCEEIRILSNQMHPTVPYSWTIREVSSSSPRLAELIRQDMSISNMMKPGPIPLDADHLFTYPVERALATARRLAEESPFDETVHANLASCLFEVGNYEESLLECQTALDISIDCHQARYTMGTCLSSLGRSEEAISCFEKLPNNPLALFQLSALNQSRSKQERYLVILTSMGPFKNEPNVLHRLSQIVPDSNRSRRFLEETYSIDPSRRY
jgi:tetratricopeptide (TPR) repeat protein